MWIFDWKVEQYLHNNGAIVLEVTDGLCMALDGLRDVPLHDVEMHGSDHPVVLGTYSDEERQ